MDKSLKNYFVNVELAEKFWESLESTGSELCSVNVQVKIIFAIFLSEIEVDDTGITLSNYLEYYIWS